MLTFKQFRQLYESDISHLAQSTQDEWYRAADALQATAKPKLLSDVDQKRLDKFMAALAKRGLRESTQKLYLAKIMAGLNWAYRRDHLERKPKYYCERLKDYKPPDSSRCVTYNEFQDLLAAVDVVRKNDAPLWKRLLRGAHVADLRISELLRLSWDSDAKVRMVRGPKNRPMILFTGKRSQKGWKPGLHTIHPLFWEVIRKDAKGQDWENPKGFVFPMLGFEHPDLQMSARNVYLVIKAIGEVSGIVTQEETGKTVTAHDFGRKAYAARLLSDPDIPIDDARKLLRHGDIRTTIKHYDSTQHEKLGDLLWNESQ